MRLRIAAIALAVAACAAPGAASAAKTPSALVKALLAAKVAASDLPHGYRSPKVTPYRISAGDRKHHVVGGVLISADNGGEAVIYLVFSTPAAARADFAHGNVASVFRIAAPKSIPKPNIEFNTSTAGKLKGKQVTVGLTDLTYVYRNVLVEAGTSSLTSATHGDVSGAALLGLYALAHLKSVD
jgi:hypothetical protein